MTNVLWTANSFHSHGASSAPLPTFPLSERKHLAQSAPLAEVRTSHCSATIPPFNAEKFDSITRANMEPFEAASAGTAFSAAHFVDDNGSTWTLADGSFKNSTFTFRNARNIQDEDGDTVLRFTCTRGCGVNGWLDVPLGDGMGFPFTHAEIHCADEDGSRPCCLSRLQLTRLV